MLKKRTEELVYYSILMLLFTIYEYEYLKSYSNLVFENAVGAYSSYFYPVMALMFILCLYVIIRESRFFTISNTSPFFRFYTRYALYIYIIGLIGSIFLVDLLGVSLNVVKTSFPLLFFIVFYYLSYRINDEKKQLVIIAISFFILVYDYYLSYQNRNIYEVVYSQTITSYFLLYMLPLLLCSNSRILKLLFCIVTTIVVLSSAKKAGTIALIAGLYVYFLILSLSKPGSKNNWWKFLVVLIVLIVAGFGINYWFNNSDTTIAARMSRLGDEGVDSRTEIWITVLARIFNSNPIAFLFGHGYDAVGLLSKDHLGAHNDFLEVFYDFGFIGFSLYCALYIKLYRMVRQLIRRHSKYAAPLGLSLTLLFILSMSSQIVTAPFFGVMFSMTWGFILAQKNIEYHNCYK